MSKVTDQGARGDRTPGVCCRALLFPPVRQHQAFSLKMAKSPSFPQPLPSQVWRSPDIPSGISASLSTPSYPAGKHPESQIPLTRRFLQDWGRPRALDHPAREQTDACTSKAEDTAEDPGSKVVPDWRPVAPPRPCATWRRSGNFLANSQGPKGRAATGLASQEL